MVIHRQRFPASPDEDVRSGTVRATFKTEQVVQALSAVAAAQGDGEIGWVEFRFVGHGRVVLTALNQNMSIRYEFLSDYEGMGTFKVSGRQVSEYVRHLPSENLSIQLELPQRLNLRSGRSSAKIQLIQDPQITDIVIPQGGARIRAKGEAIARWVDCFRDFVLVDDTRYYANGAYISVEGTPGSSGHLEAVASDAMRLARAKLLEDVDVEENDNSHVLVPRKVLDEVRRVCLSEPGRVFVLRWSEERLFFALETENYTLFARCIAGQFPPYESAIPKAVRITAQTDIKAFLDSLRRALIFADKNRLLKLRFDGPTLSIRSFTPGMKEGEEVVDLLNPVESPVEVNYNGTLLTGVLSVLSGSSAVFQWEDVNRPVKLIGDQPERGLEVFYLLVPARF